MTTINNLSPRSLLIILDGYGLNQNTHLNAIKDAKTPTLDSLFKHYPHTQIEAGGISVGLPKGVCGNSEVGHMNLGAGRPVRQDLVCINESIEKNQLKDLEELKKLMNYAKTGNKRIHLFGLLSDGGVHSHINHIKEIAALISQEKDIELFLHALMDGRDTPQNIGQRYIQEVESWNTIKLASLQGRSIGMDRDRRWAKIELSYQTMIGQGATTNLNAIDYMKEQYNQGIYDEFITPVLLNKDYAIREGDAFFFINFRPDRAIQMSLALADPKFKEFPVPIRPGYFLCMTPYIPDEVELPILFNKEKVKGGISEYLSQLGKKQIKIAETEKYAHVTFFFNGGEKKPFPGEEHILVPSPKDVATYDLKPEMSAPEVTTKLISLLDDKSIDFYVVNFANSDMVGHTGNYQAAKKAIEALDHCISQLVTKCQEQNMAFLLTADHGNSDQMVYDDGTPHTSHTGAPVPCLLFHPSLKDHALTLNGDQKALKDIAPTMLSLMGLEIPSNYIGTPIFK